METLSLYSVRDSKADAFGVPFTAVNDQVATRMFEQLTNDEASTIYSYPEDYALYKIGSFNTQHGELEPENPIHLKSAISLKKDLIKN